MASDELLTEKKYFSITEVSQICNIKSHTLRFWEKEFEELKPLTRKGNRRYYQKEDIELIKRIQSLLYDSGMTISGAKKNLNFRNNSQNENPRSKKILEELISRNPDDAYVLNYLSYSMAIRNEDLIQAKKLIIRALEIEKNN